MPKPFDVTFSVKGVEKLVERLSRMRQAYPREFGRAINVEGEKILTNAKKIVPHELGDLTNTGRVHVIRDAERIITEVEVSFGGDPEGLQPKADRNSGGVKYAAAQHEEEGWQHEPGRQAKYLEVPFQQAVKGMSVRVARRIKAAVK